MRLCHSLAALVTTLTEYYVFTHCLSYAIVVYHPFDYPSLCRLPSGTVPCVLRLWPCADHNDDCTVCDRHCQASFSCLVDRIVRIWAWHAYVLEIYKPMSTWLWHETLRPDSDSLDTVGWKSSNEFSCLHTFLSPYDRSYNASNTTFFDLTGVGPLPI